MARSKPPARNNTGGYELSPRAQEIVAAFGRRKAMKKKDVVQRVMGFFAAQPKPLKSLMAGLADEEMAEAYAKYLCELADRIRRGENVETMWLVSEAEEGGLGENGVGLVHNGTPVIVDPNEAKSRGRKRQGSAGE